MEPDRVERRKGERRQGERRKGDRRQDRERQLDQVRETVSAHAALQAERRERSRGRGLFRRRRQA